MCIVYCCVAQDRKAHMERVRLHTAEMSRNETLYFLLRIKIEEEYAKNLSKLSQIHLAGQEEG